MSGKRGRLLCILIVSLGTLVVGGSLEAQKVHPGMDVETSPKLIAELPRIGEIEPPDEYARWWGEIARCEGLQIPAQVDKVRFYAVNAEHFWTPGTPIGWFTLAAGYVEDLEIFLSLPLVLNERIVKHEMLHFLLHWAGYRFKNFHPVEFFETCGLHRTGL